MPIPAHLISGFLGAGKTTTLLHLLRALKGRGEKVAVLVNEFGALGIDGTTLSTGEAISVKEIPDGCICCTLAGRLMEALEQIATQVQPQRLFIEPTGLARPEEIRRLLKQDELANRYALAPVLTIVDPATYLRLLGKHMPFYAGQIAEADIVVANKLDRLQPGQIERFRQELPKLNPRARLLEVTFGKVPEDVLQGLTGQAQTAFHPIEQDKTAEHRPGHHHPQGESVSLRVEESTKFDAGRLQAFFTALQRGELGVKPWRAKGIFRCGDGWLLFNVSESGVDAQAGVPSPGESRCDVVAEHLTAQQRQDIVRGLEACAVREGQAT